MDSTLAVLLDGRPLRAPLSGVGHYVRSLAAAMVDLDRVDLGILEFDFLSRHRAYRHSLGIDHAKTIARPHRLLHRKVFNGIAAYTDVPIAAAIGLGRYDIIHETYFERLGAARFTSAGRRRQARVSTIHDVGFLRHPEWFDKRNLAASRRALASQAAHSDVVLTPSAFTRAELLELTELRPDQVLVTPLAAADADSTLHDHPVGRPQRPYALYVGNIDPRKNLRALIEAWRAVDLGREFELILVGAPLPGSTDFAESLRNMQSSGIRYAGYVSDSERGRLLSRASCFVYPSSYEGFGLPVLEAMRMGVPVVTSDAPALVELAGSAALVAPLGMPLALGEALQSVLHDEGLQASLKQAGSLRAREFSWRRTAEATLAAYRSAVLT